DLQTLDADHLVLMNNAGRELVLIIPSAVPNLGMETGNLEPCLCSVLAALLFLGSSPLCLGQFLLIFAEVLWIAHKLTIRGDNHRLQAQVKPNLFGDNRKGLDILFNEDGHEVASGRIFGDSNGRWLTSLGQGTRPNDIQGSIHLSKCERVSIPLEGSTYVR